MNDFKRIRENVELMASKNAPPEKIREYLADEGMTSAQFKARMEGIADAGRMDSMLRYSAGSGPANLLDLPGRTVVAAANLATMAGGVAGNKLFGMKPPETIPPDQLDVFNPLFRKAGLINDDYAPTDGPGNVLDFTTQSLTGGGLNPASLVRNASRGLIKPVARDVTAATLSGAGAGVGSVLSDGVNTGSQSLDAAIKAAATFSGGAVPGGVVAARGTAGDRASVAVKGVTPEQMALARELKRTAAKKGSPITDYEAIQGITGLNPKMQTQQRLAEQSDAGATTLIPIMQNRSKSNSALFNNSVDSIAPIEQYPDTLAGLLQKAARESIDSVRQQRTEAVRPNYQAAKQNTAEAMRLLDQTKSLKNKWDDRIDSRNQASQISGKLSAEANQQDILSKNFYPVPGQPKFPQRYTNQKDRAEEYAKAGADAKSISSKRLDEAIDAERQFYEAQDALAEKNIPYVQGRVRGFLSDLDNEIKLANPNTTEGKILQSFRDEIAPNGELIYYPSQLESIYKANRDKLDLPFQPTPFDKTQAGVLGGHVKNLDALIKEVSPEIAAARLKYSQMTRDVVSPMESSQIGKLARSDDFKQQSTTFLPDQPADVTPSVVSRTADTIGQQDPDILKRFLAQDLRRKFSEANQRNMGGENAFGGPKFAANVAGNADQEANLIAAIKASGGNVEPFKDAINIFRAQGYKPSANSATMPNADEASRLGGTLSALTAPFRAIPGAIDQWRNGMATSALAKALAAQDEAGPMRIEELARINGVHDPMKQQMLINLLLANPQNQ